MRQFKPLATSASAHLHSTRNIGSLPSTTTKSTSRAVHVAKVTKRDVASEDVLLKVNPFEKMRGNQVLETKDGIENEGPVCVALVHESLLTPASTSTQLLDTLRIEEMSRWPRASPAE